MVGTGDRTCIAVDAGLTSMGLSDRFDLLGDIGL